VEALRTPRRFDTADGPRWRVRYRLGGIETSETFRRQPDAKRFAEILGNGTDGRTHDALAWLEARRRHVEDDLTFARWFEAYLAQLTGITKRTRADYEAIHRRYLTDLDTLPLTLITKAHVANLINELDQDRKLSPKTIKNAIYLLSSVMGEAVEEGHIGRSPVRKLRLPRPEAHDDLVRFLTYDEAGALVEATPEATARS
jgi:integrase